MQDLIKRIHNVTELYDRLSASSRIVVQTDIPHQPAYLTTHFDKDYACVQIASQVAGTTGPTHVHEASEWFFVLKGSIVVRTLEDRCVLPGEIVEVTANMAHAITAVEDAIFVVITMPSILSEISSTNER